MLNIKCTLRPDGDKLVPVESNSIQFRRTRETENLIAAESKESKRNFDSIDRIATFHPLASGIEYPAEPAGM